MVLKYQNLWESVMTVNVSIASHESYLNIIRLKVKLLNVVKDLYLCANQMIKCDNMCVRKLKPHVNDRHL